MNSQNTRSGLFRRRNFLRTTSIATMGALGLEPVSAKQDEYGSVSFVEAGLFHRTSVPEVDGSFAFIHIDDRIAHGIGEDESVLYLSSTADDSTKRLFERNEYVSNFVGYHSFPTTIDRSSDSVVTTELGRAYRRTYGLKIDDSYGAPAIGIGLSERNGTDDVVVSGEKMRLEVQPGTSRSVQLQSRTVQAPVEKPSEGQVENSDIPEHKRARRMTTRLETVSITPIFKVVNYGQLDVRETP